MSLAAGIWSLIGYETQVLLPIRNRPIAVIYRIVQLGILAYIFTTVIGIQKGYQLKDHVESAVTAKVKGVVYTNYSDTDLKSVPREWHHLYRRLWDVTDYVIPPTENNAFFVTTNLIVTPNQTQGKCPEDPAVPGAVCDPEDSNACPPGGSTGLGHGVNTGKCVLSDTIHEQSRSRVHVCEIHAWCPVEKNIFPLGPDKALLAAAENFTVLIKNHIRFPLYGLKRTNILDSSNSTYLKSCMYNDVTDLFCPVFRLGTIARLAGEDFQQLAVNGSVIAINIEWNCNLDFDFMKNCLPQYKFRRLDNPEAKIAQGWNFRHSHYFSDNQRTLYKPYGILFIIEVQGIGGKFNLFPLLINTGASLGLLSLAVISCDVLLNLVGGATYKNRKYVEEYSSNAYNSLDNSTSNAEDAPPDNDSQASF